MGSKAEDPEGTKFCGDSRLISNILPEDFIGGAFQSVHEELSWSEMLLKGSLVPRLISVQGDLTDDFIEPIYRHPADAQPELILWTSTVRKIRDIISEKMEINLNHALIQLYRSGQDNISEHCDKTLDIARGTSIYTVSLGAKRNLILRSKDKVQNESRVDGITEIKKRESVSVPLEHNSLFILDSETNRRYLHCIKADKRSGNLKSPDELAYGEMRISLTFRCISTFYDRKNKILFGQGAPQKHEIISEFSSVRSVFSSTNTTSNISFTGTLNERRSDKIEENQSVEHLRIHDSVHNELMTAFSAENKLSDFNWEHYYGRGFPLLTEHS